MDEWKAFNYIPMLSVNIQFAAVFAVFLAVQVLYSWHLHTKYSSSLGKTKLKRFHLMMIPFSIGMALEVVGFAGRIINHYDLQSLAGFIIQAVCILLGPTFMAATIYMLFGEIVKTLDASHHSVVPIAKLTKIFVGGDLLSLTLQSTGGSLTTNDLKMLYNIGEKIILGGLFVQLIFFGVFVLCVLLFYVKCSNSPTKSAAMNSARSSIIQNWKIHVILLVVASLLILGRSVYRVIEFLQGANGILISDEKYLFLLDSHLVALAALHMIVFYTPSMLCYTEKENMKSSTIRTDQKFSVPETEPVSV